MSALLKPIEAPRRIELPLWKCRRICEEQGTHELTPDRHYPFFGSIGSDVVVRFLRLNMMVGPLSHAQRFENFHPFGGLKGYKLYSSCQYGAEDWARYGWWNGLLSWKLVPGDVIQEKYYFRYDQAYAFNNFLVVEDRGRSLVLYPIGMRPCREEQGMELPGIGPVPSNLQELLKRARRASVRKGPNPPHGY